MTLTDSVLFRRREAEKQLCMIATVQPDIVLNACGWVDEAMFSDERYSKFWGEFKRIKDPTAAAIAVSYDFLAELSLDLPYYHTKDVATYANVLANESYLFTMASTWLPGLANAIAEGDAIKAQQVVSDIVNHPPNVVRHVPDAADMSLEFLASLDDDRSGVPSFIEKFDKVFGGYWKRNFYVIAARPGVGKTAWLMQCARNAAQSGRRVLVASKEMSAVDLWERMACGSARVNIRDMKAKRITADQRESIIQATGRLQDTLAGKLYIDDSPVYSTNQMWQQVSTLKPDIVFTDHLRLFSDRERGEREDQRLGRISWAHKQIAKEFGIPVVAAAQLNRNSTAREDKRPTLSDLRDSGQIEENADVVIGLHRDSTYVESSPVKSPAELVGMKFRNGPADVLLKLTFDGVAQWFEGA